MGGCVRIFQAPKYTYTSVGSLPRRNTRLSAGPKHGYTILLSTDSHDSMAWDWLQILRTDNYGKAFLGELGAKSMHCIPSPHVAGGSNTGLWPQQLALLPRVPTMYCIYLLLVRMLFRDQNKINIPTPKNSRCRMSKMKPRWFLFFGSMLRNFPARRSGRTAWLGATRSIPQLQPKALASRSRWHFG